MFAAFEPNSAILGPSPIENPSHRPHQAVKPGRRRDKPQLSCRICRQKKLKCDRQKPCHNCTKRGQPESCDYIKQDPSRARLPMTTNVQERIRQLEDKVVALLNGQTGQGTPSAEASPSATHLAGPKEDDGFTPSAYDQNIPEASPGVFTRAKNQVNFVGSEHWESVLEDITELRIDLETDDSAMTDFKPQILFGINHASVSEILSSIPPRPVCDSLVSRWFRSMDMASMVVHVPTFMEEYNRMFDNPSEMPLMWIGLLFSVLGLGSYFYAASGEELHTMPEQFTSMWEMSQFFRDLTAQCLKEVNYLRPQQYTLQTLSFYFAIEKFQTSDSEFGVYVILGIIVKVAMRLGYHRDPKHYGQISIFHGEMRRRLWSLILQLDLVASAQVGLPRTIREQETDTAEPKNLLDSDLNECMTELPHPRPGTDITPVSFAISMVRVLRQLGGIVEQVNSTTPPSYEEVMSLDSKLLETHATLPQYLSMRALGHSITDDVNIIIRRYALEVCFQKSRCVLHRKYLTRFQYSRAAAVDAAMKLLDVQYDFHKATQPGGQLNGEQWRPSALLNQDYILAAMILCFELTWDTKLNKNLSLEDRGEMQTKQNPEATIEMEAMWPRTKRLQALKDSYAIWCESSTTSALAAKAKGALRVMLQNLESVRSEEAMPTTLISIPLNVTDARPATEPLAYNSQAYSMTSNEHNSVLYPVETMATEFFMGTTDIDMNFDWDLWDSEFGTIPPVLDDFGPLTLQ